MVEKDHSSSTIFKSMDQSMVSKGTPAKSKLSGRRRIGRIARVGHKLLLLQFVDAVREVETSEESYANILGVASTL